MKINDFIMGLQILQRHRPKGVVMADSGLGGGIIFMYGPDFEKSDRDYAGPLNLTEGEATFLDTTGWQLYEINAGWSED